jgi:hypothetical protein
MSSQLDLDQGGTYREKARVYLGPSIGWVEVSWQAILNVTAGGTTNILRGTNLILVNFNGAATIQLPSFKATAAGGMAIPAQFALIPIVICDVGGFAFANPITVLPFGTELISGLASVPIASNFGSLVIRPDIVNGGGTLMQ